MISKIQDLIKTDQKSQEKIIEFEKEFKRKSIITVVMLSVASMLIIVFFIFAVGTKMKADSKIQSFETKMEQLQTDLENCRLE